MIIMATPPASPPRSNQQSEAMSKNTRRSTWLRMLTRRTLDQLRPIVTVDAATGRGSSPHKEKFHNYLGVVVREKVPIVHNSWKDVLDTLKELVWNDILAKFDILEALHAKKKVMSTVATRWRQFKSSLTIILRAKRKKILQSNMALMHKYRRNLWQPAKPLIGRKKMQEIQKNNDCPHLLYREGYDLLEKKLLDEKIKKRQHDPMMTENPLLIEDPPSPIKRHVMWKMALTNRYGKMTSEAARQIADKLIPWKNKCHRVSLSPGEIKSWRSCSCSWVWGHNYSILWEDITCLNYLIHIIHQRIAWKNELKVSIITDIFKGDKVSTSANFDLNLLAPRMRTKESYVEIAVNPSGEEHVGRVTSSTGLYVQSQDCTKLVALQKIYDGPFTIHCVAYADDVVRVSVKKVIDGEAKVPFATSEIKYVREALNTFIAWPLPLVKLVSNEHSGMTPNKVAKVAELNNDVPKQDPLRELIKTLIKIYDKPVEFVWDLTEFGIPNVNSSLFLMYTDVSEITSDDKCLNIAIHSHTSIVDHVSKIHLYMNEWSNGLGHRSMYGFLEPQSIHNAKDRRGQCEEYIEKWIKESQRQLYI
ncbi:hypothetical protein HKD37_03G006831 [Glycine soja]